MGQKSPHSYGIPICHREHMDFHANAGRFKGWKRAELRQWQEDQVLDHQARWERRKCVQEMHFG
jgi:hypothetical protein